MTASFRILLPVFVLALLAPPILAQSLNDPMLEGALAFREERFSDAAQAFQRAIAADPDNAEAHFLLARIYFETPLKDVKRAGRELDRALDLDGENVRYMVARLQQLRSEASNFLVDKIRESKRRELAKSILRRDSVNAFAHEEFGIAYIRDFWKYRNALMLPNVDFNRYGEARTAIGDDDLFQIDDELILEDDAGFVATSEGGDPLQRFNDLDPNAVFLADEFDVETLQSMGAPVSDLSGRAQRAYDRAIGHLNQSLETDPRHRSVYDYLMEIYALKGEWAEALTMLQQMYVYFPNDPDLWTYLGLAHYRNGNPDAASKAFETALGDMDEQTLRAYVLPEDLIPVEDRDEYRADPTGFTSRFWSSKDPRFLTPYNERKLEHYSRLTYADLLYRSEPLNLRGWETERGRILVRYGVPQGDITIVPFSRNNFNRAASPGGSPSGGTTSSGESEAIQAGRYGTDFDPFEDTNTYNIWDYGDFRFVFEDPFRTGEYRMFSPGANDVSAGALPWINDYAILAQETFREYPERYEYESPARQVELPFLVSSFKGRNGNADLFVNYGIPVNDGPDSNDLLDITAKFGTFVIGANRDILSERRRTIYGLRGEQVVTFKEQNLWVDSEILTVPPGEADVSVEFETASGGTVGVQRRSIDVPDFSSDRLALSDLLLAYRVEETDNGRALAASEVVRNGLSIMPAPWSVFSTDQPIYIYFEVYGLEQSGGGQARYEVEAALVPKEDGSRVGNFVRGLFGGGGAGVSVRLPVAVEARDDGQYLIMDASNQEPGLYTIQFRVRDLNSGRDVDAEQDLFLE